MIVDHDDMWMPPMEALLAITKAVNSRDEAIHLLRDALSGGALVTRGIRANELMRGGKELGLGLLEAECVRQQIPAPFWAGASAADERSWSWIAGSFKSACADGLKLGCTEYFEVEFARVDIRGLFEDYGLDSEYQSVDRRASIERPVNKGGRPSSKHGEPIAELSIKLFRMGDEFNRYTGESLATELKDAYANYSLPIPIEENLKGISYGILRAVRRARE